jgi:hypothetical protein
MVDEAKVKADLAPILMAAQGVVSRAFEMSSSVIELPLRVLAGIYWKQAIQKAGLAPRDIAEVQADAFIASSTGLLYWIPPGGEHPTPFENSDAQDAWLAEKCVKMGRVTVDQIVVPMEPTFWQQGAASPMMQQLNGQIESAFESVLEVIVSSKPDKGMLTLATLPVVSFTESRDNPFTGLITIYSRCGFWMPPQPTA